MTDSQKLDDLGIESVRDLAIAQDNTTWVALSVFVAAETVLLAAALGPGSLKLHRLVLMATGLVLAVLSFLVVSRSNAYLVTYWRLLRETGRPEFNQQDQVTGIRSWHVIVVMHAFLFLLWLVLMVLFGAIG